MTREQLAHILRSASQIAGERDVVVLGSQSVLGTYDEGVLPDEAVGSIEADVAFLHDPDNEKSDKVEWAIGDLSDFQSMYQYYAEGVNISVAVLGPEWESRLVVFENESTAPGRGLCLEPHDCVAAKLAAGRDKDFEFSAAMLSAGLVESEILIRRIRSLPIPADQIRSLEVWVEARR